MQRRRWAADTRRATRVARGLLLLLAASACATPGSGQTEAARVRPGISVLLTDSIHLIRGRRVGLITNQTGIDERGESDIDRLRGAEARAAGVRLVTLFSPEHGIRGTEDRENLASGVDARTGLFIHSLYASATIGPPDSTLRDLDVLVVDLQDIGTRTWTYVGVVLYSMRAAARRNLPIVVLDRPNPIERRRARRARSSTPRSRTRGADRRRGRARHTRCTRCRCGTRSPWARWRATSTRSCASAHGCHVVPAAGWRRAMWFDETGLPWVRPSPNMPTLASATVYPAIVAVRGHQRQRRARDAGCLPATRRAVVARRQRRRAAERARAPRRAVRAQRLHAPRTRPTGSTPAVCVGGIRVVVTDRDRFAPGRTGAALLWAIRRRRQRLARRARRRLGRSLRPAADARGDHARRGSGRRRRA